MICSLFFFWAVISYLTFIQSDCKHFLERPWGNWSPKLNLIWRPEAKSGNYWHLHLLLQKSTLPFLLPNFMLMFHQRERESPWWGSDTEPSLKCISHGETQIMTVQLWVWTHTLAFPPYGNTACSQGLKHCLIKAHIVGRERMRGQDQRARSCNLFCTFIISSVSHVTLMKVCRTFQRI